MMYIPVQSKYMKRERSQRMMYIPWQSMYMKRVEVSG